MTIAIMITVAFVALVALAMMLGPCIAQRRFNKHVRFISTLPQQSADRIAMELVDRMKDKE